MRNQVKGTLLGVAAALAVVGGVAVAGNVTIPHSFAPNTTVKAADFNDNFAAVKAAVDDNQTQITALQNGTYDKTAADGRFTRLRACYWKYQSCNAGSGTTCAATCNTGDYVVSGGCDANAAGPALLYESFPRPSNNDYKTAVNIWPFGAAANDPVNPVIDQWFCRVSTGFVDNAYAFCCPPR